MRRAVLFALPFALAALPSCGSNHDAACTPGGDGHYVDTPYDKLADYCLVGIEDGKIVPRAGVVPYEVKNPLFSDYALKARSVWLPNGQKARYDADRAFEFPVGTIVTKSFGYPDDPKTPTPTSIAADGPPSRVRWIETRLLVRAQDGWRAYTYAWDDAQKEATLRPGGGIVEVDFSDASGKPRHASYLVPNQIQCKKCHADGESIVPIGLRADQLHVGDQIARWTKAGILDGAPDQGALPAVATWSDAQSGSVESRARAYLAANCSYCHFEGGSARTSGLYLGPKVTNPYELGVCKTPVAAGKATANMQFDIVPGKPDLSILVHRMHATEPQIAMPEIGRSLAHDEAIDLVSQWIGGMTGACTNP